MNIVCVGFPKWEGEYLKSTVQLMEALSERHHVLYVDYAYTITDVAKALMGKRKFPVTRILGIRNRMVKIKDNKAGSLHILRLSPVLPTRWIDNARAHDIVINLFAKRHAKEIKKAIDRLGMTDWHMINAFQPIFGVGLMKYLKPKQTTYYCYDEISAASWVSKHGERLEKRFVEKCDLILTSSKPLMEQKKQFNFNIKVIKNGVSPEYFTKPDSISVPDDVPYGNGKIVGYIGTVDDRLDMEILTLAFEARKDYQFVFIGRCIDESVRHRLESYDNVHLLGPKPLDQLKHYLACIDIGIIPFVKNSFTRNIYPLKINEYLIQGKPVVTTDFSDLSDFEDMVEIVSTPDDFIKALDNSFQAKSNSIEQQIISFAYANTWEARSVEFERALEAASAA